MSEDEQRKHRMLYASEVARTILEAQYCINPHESESFADYSARLEMRMEYLKQAGFDSDEIREIMGASGPH